MTTSTVPAIQRQVTVNAPLERAFDTFTSSFGTWWPAAYHIGEAEMAEALLEPRAGGRWYERGIDGSECDWGSVLAWEPPHRLVLGWQINGRWQYDPNPANASEIEVRFTADGPERTLVELEHRYLDRLGDAQDLAAAVAAETGWTGILKAYADAARTR
jgi:uncharacterized protein YndB with AHSA1/START domain